jgi:hypothetical protein
MNSQAPLLALSPLFTERSASLEDTQRLSDEAKKAVAAFFHEGTSRNTGSREQWNRKPG